MRRAYGAFPPQIKSLRACALPLMSGAGIFLHGGPQFHIAAAAAAHALQQQVALLADRQPLLVQFPGYL